MIVQNFSVEVTLRSLSGKISIKAFPSNPAGDVSFPNKIHFLMD